MIPLERPKWVTVIGRLGIIRGVLGILGFVQMFLIFLIPPFRDFYLGLFRAFEFDLTFIILTTMVGFFQTAFILYVSHTLLKLKPYAVTLFYTAVTINILIVIFTILYTLVNDPYNALMILSSFISFLWLLVEITVLIIVITRDKTVFEIQQRFSLKKITDTFSS